MKNDTQYFEYFPFGETFFEDRHDHHRTPYLFNGKELDKETGLYYYGARYYDPRISMFYGVDPLTEKYANQSPFAYAANNPVKFIDVLGMGPDDPDENKPNKAVIAPGHGGTDPGAVKRNGKYNEKDINLIVGTKVNEILSENGISSVMTREGDTKVSLDDERKKSNEENANVFVSIHVNSSQAKSTDRDAILVGTKDKTNSETDKLAKLLVSTISAEVTPKDGVNLDPQQGTYDVLLTEGVNDINYDGYGEKRNYMHKPGTAAVIVELGFINNPSNEKLLNNPAYLNKIANGIAQGIIKFYEQK